MVYTVGGVQYTRRKNIPVTGAASGAQTNYQIKLTALWAAAMQADYDDVRFTKADMQTLIDAWLESKTDSTTADIWAEFPTTPADGVVKTEAYMYFGNAGIADYWDIGATFVFGDDFPGSSIDTSKWSIDDATGLSVTGGELKRINSSGKISTLSSFSQPTTIETKYRGPGSIGGDGTMVIGTFGSTSDAAGAIGYESGSAEMRYIRDDGAWVDPGSGGYNRGDTNYFIARMIAASGNVTIKALSLAYSEEFTYMFSNTVSSEKIRLGRRYDDATNGQSCDSRWDWIRARKYAANPPTAAFGTEEHQRRTPMMI